MILLGLVGLKGLCRPGFKRESENYRDAGVKIKMIIEDQIFILRAIIMECEILNIDEDLNNAVVKDFTFINYTKEEQMEKIEMIRGMVISSPFDKLLMV